jgi:uncharacterized membrane protein YccC
LLAGYTAAIVGIPAALNPDQAYTLIVARGTEVALGVAFAALFTRLLIPRNLAQRLLALTGKVVVQARQFAFVVFDPTADKTKVVEQGILLIQDLASIESMRASAYFESNKARRLNESIRQVDVAALRVCAVAEDITGRGVSASRPCGASPEIMARLLSRTDDSPVGNGAVTSTLVSVADRRDMFDAEAEIDGAERRLEGKSPAIHPTVPLETWPDSSVAVLTGVRTALAVAVAWLTWVVTAWPSGPIAIIVAASVCSLLAAMEQPATISLALAVTILVATVPVFVTVFYLLPLASDFVSMALALAPLLLICGFIMAQPKIGQMGQLTAVYFTVASNIDNVMNYDTVQFFNTSLAILFGIGVSLVLFATIFPETPSRAVHFLRKQLRYRLSRFSVVPESTLSSFAYALCDQAANTLIRVKNESSAMQQCYTMTMTGLSTAYAISSLKKTLNAALPPRTKHEIEMLLGRVSQTFAKPSRAGLVKQAWEARCVRIRVLKEARSTNKRHEAIALGHALVGCERLRAGLLRSRILLDEPRHAR